MPFKTNLFYSVCYCKTLLTSAKESGDSSSLRRKTEPREERVRGEECCVFQIITNLLQVEVEEKEEGPVIHVEE